MERERWGIVGIGNLGGAILSRLGSRHQFIHFYHPDERKAEAIAQAYPGHVKVGPEELANFDFLILSLPADRMAPFVKGLVESNLSLGNVTLINMATSLRTEELIRQFPQVKWLGMKFMGHSADLRSRGNGLFVTEPYETHTQEQEQAIRFFEALGQVIFDKEAVVEEVNRLATGAGVKAAMELERAVREGGYRQEYVGRALLSIAPEVMRAYGNGTMGHFARRIAEQLEGERRS